MRFLRLRPDNMSKEQLVSRARSLEGEWEHYLEAQRVDALVDTDRHAAQGTGPGPEGQTEETLGEVQQRAKKVRKTTLFRLSKGQNGGCCVV